MASKKIIRSDEVNMLCRQMALLIASGLTSAEAISALVDERDNTPMGRLLASMDEEVRRGAPASAVLTRNIPQLKGIPAALVDKGGEDLSQMFRELATYNEKRQETKKLIKASLVYPSIILSVAVAIVALLTVVVVPMLAGMFAEMGQALPLPTRIVIAVSDFMKGWGGLFLFIVLTALVVIIRKNKALALGVADRLPILQNLGRTASSAEFLRTLALMTMAKQPLSESLQASANMITNPYHAEQMHGALSGVNDVPGLVAAMRQTTLLPQMMQKTLAAGERSGMLSSALAEMADYMEREAARAAGRFTASLEPLLMIFLGTTVGFVIIAMYMPIFQMGSVVGK